MFCETSCKDTAEVVKQVVKMPKSPRTSSSDQEKISWYSTYHQCCSMIASRRWSKISWYSPHAVSHAQEQGRSVRRQHNHATRRRESACFRDARPPRGRAAGGGNVAARASLVHALGSGVVCLTGGAPLHARPLAAKAGSCATRAAACTATAAERGRSSPRRQQQLARTRAFCTFMRAETPFANLPRVVRERFGCAPRNETAPEVDK